VVAFVQLRAGESPCEPELLDRCRGALARYKVPESITFVDEFERTPMGKIRRNALLGKS
jgi:acyl-CoA synthetase (AMP-forming)/AMP-acid ligase II